MIFDSHIHTEMSGDSEMKLLDAIKVAKDKKIGLILTEHMDINDYILYRSGFDVDKFYKEYSKYRGDELLFGIELGLKEEAVQRNIELIDKYDFDYILGSIHAPYDCKTQYEFFNKETYEGKTKREIFEKYFDSMIRGIRENDYIHSLAHIDYICRYNIYEDKELYYDEHKEHIDEVIKELVARDISMEISTRRIGNIKSYDELVKIYKRFRELGGETVTIGSDAHYPGGVGLNIDKAVDIAQISGLKPVYYKKRKREYIKY